MALSVPMVGTILTPITCRVVQVILKKLTPKHKFASSATRRTEQGRLRRYGGGQILILQRLSAYGQVCKSLMLQLLTQRFTAQQLIIPMAQPKSVFPAMTESQPWESSPTAMKLKWPVI